MKTKRTNFRARISIFLLFCGVVVFWGFQVSGEEWTDAQKEVWKSVETEWEYLIKGNLEGVMGCYDDDAVKWFLWWRPDEKQSYNQPIASGKDLIEAQYNSWLSGHFKPVSYELEPLAIHIFGDVANVFYQYKWKKGGIPKTILGKAMVSYKKQHNTWLITGKMKFRKPGTQ